MRDEARAVREGDGVRLDLTENLAGVLRAILVDFAEALVSRAENVQDDRLFPDAYRKKADSDGFRERHGARMRAEVQATLESVLARWPDGTTFVLDRAGVRDLRLVHAQARYLRRPRWKARRPEDFLARRDHEVKSVWLGSLDNVITTALLVDPAEPVSYTL
ncbi:hypothetical protein AB0N89_34805 [Amycolatopsis sp. NPDC089917]|uniref:DUF2017 family protein n=1 Tax=Amycolatopsis sp. NPDC089917 TaxID=3155187 RepID=UPI00343F0771